MGRNASLFPEPEVYRPERWLRNNSLREKSQFTKQSFASLPFGHGPRTCIGNYMNLYVPLHVADIIMTFLIKCFLFIAI